MADFQDLIQVTQNTYQRLADPKGGKDLNVTGELQLIAYAKDEKTDHGGLAYYDKEKKK